MPAPRATRSFSTKLIEAQPTTCFAESGPEAPLERGAALPLAGAEVAFQAGPGEETFQPAFCQLQ